ncbi:TetR/AcrR family transcriptional regulator [Carnobacterium sp.]|uniref:TetR/AcrR family transcriptional regulator n=1 Tax=Carnobacterium sp. TaxID=48221 RepID=UPI003C70D11E
MKDLLNNVNPDKKDRIINSAMKEFSLNTFQKASTNTIVKEAGISKGLLFHYFGNKETVFNYLEYFVFKVMTESIIDELNWDQKDIFLRLKEITLIKFKVFQRYPYLADFSLVVFKDKTIEDIMSINPDFPLELYSKIYTHNIDYSLFKKEIDKDKAIDIIRWTLEKYSDELRVKTENGQMTVDYSLVEKDFFSYIKILKSSFYE